RKGSLEIGNGFRHLLDGLLVPRGDRFNEVTRQCHARRDLYAAAHSVPKSHRLRSIKRRLARFIEGDDSFHSSTVTSPASPSTRTSMPSVMRSVASRVPTTPGIPYSRDTIAACES